MALLHDVLRDVRCVEGLCPGKWDLLIRQARHANLLGRLFHHVERGGLLPTVPQRAINHMRSAAVMAERQHLSVKYEVRFLRDALESVGLPLILLKGAAYVLADLPSVRGRIFGDLDILVPKSRLSDVESVLMLTGWVSATQDDYDQRYYRQWMHELPAMQHLRRGSSLDVHHTILPPTSRLMPDAAALIASSVDVSGWPGVKTLSPCDMVLHSAAHLFHEGEADNLLRDLSDLDLLLRHFGADQDFWSALIERAEVVQLQSPLRLALRYVVEFLATPVPAATMDAVGASLSRSVSHRLLDFIYRRVFNPRHASTTTSFTSWSEKALYIRAHWLRMPPHLLLYHLSHKALFPPKNVHISEANNR